MQGRGVSCCDAPFPARFARPDAESSRFRDAVARRHSAALAETHPGPSRLAPCTTRREGRCLVFARATCSASRSPVAPLLNFVRILHSVLSNMPHGTGRIRETAALLAYLRSRLLALRACLRQLQVIAAASIEQQHEDRAVSVGSTMKRVSERTCGRQAGVIEASAHEAHSYTRRPFGRRTECIRRCAR